MKKLLTLFSLAFFAFGTMPCKAQSGGTCAAAISLNSPSCINDSLPADSARWYSFTAAQASQTIQIILAPGSVGHVHQISLYNACAGSPVKQATVLSNSQDTLALTDTSLLTGNVYYVQLSDNTLGCVRCSAGSASYRICRINAKNDSSAGCTYWQMDTTYATPLYHKVYAGCACPSGLGDCPNPSTTICRGDTVYFSTSASNCPYLNIKYDTTTLLLHSNTATYYVFNVPPGQYGAYFSDSSNSVFTPGVTIYVVAPPSPSFILNPNTVCMGDSVTLTKTDNAPGDCWAWSIDYPNPNLLNFLSYDQPHCIDTTPYTFPACNYALPGSPYTIGLIETTGTLYIYTGDGGIFVNGCTRQVTETLTVNDLNPTFTVNYNTCKGGYAEFTNTSTCPSPVAPGYSWDWDFGDGSPHFTGPNPPPHLYNQSGGPYTVTCTVTITGNLTACSGDSKSSTQIVNVVEPPTITITGPDLACTDLERGYDNYCATVTGPGTYAIRTWSATANCTDDGPYLECPGTHAGETYTFNNISLGGTIYYSVTDVTTGCVYTDSLVVRGCCQCQDYQSLSTDEDMSYIAHNLALAFTPSEMAHNVFYDSNTNTLTFVNWKNSHPGPLIINGLMDADVNLVFNNCDLRMGTNAQIKVEPGYNLNLNGTYVHSCQPCSNAWQGIYVYGTAKATIAQSLIEDAASALVSFNGGNYYVYRSVLNKDYTGITVNNYNGTHPGIITASTIACNTSHWPALNLTAATTLIAPFTGERTHAGMVVNNVKSITIGSVGVNPDNTFQNMDYGIISEASGINVINDKFNDKPPIKSAAGGVTGIYLIGDPTGTISANIGKHVTHGGNTFDNWTYGVIERDTMNALITDNNITASAVPVTVENNLKNKVTVQYNTMLKIGSVGIDCYNNPYSSVNITENSLTNIIGSVYSPAGIYLSEINPSFSRVYNVDNNTITGLYEGVIVNNNYNTGIDRNTIAIRNNHTAFNYGIYLGGSVLSRVFHNQVTLLPSLGGNLSSGIYLNMGSGSNLVNCNTTLFTNNGIVFAGPNVTTGMYNNLMSNNTQGLYLLPSTVVGTNGAANSPNDNQWLACTNSTYSFNPPNTFWVRNPPGTSYYPTNNSGLGVSFSGTTGTSCLNCATGLFNVDCNPGGGGNPNTARALSIINDSTPFTVYPHSSHWLYKYSLYKYLQTHDSLLSNYYVLHFRDSVKAANMGMLDRVSTLLADSNGVNYTDITAATNLNASVSAPDTIEQTTKAVNNISLAMQTAKANFPDSAQITTLKTIAPLCPAEYGNAVFVARALLSQVDTTHYISACEIASGGISGARIMGSKTENSNLLSPKVYPTPANTQLTVIMPLQPGQTAYFCLYNSIGESAKCETLSNPTTTINTGRMSAGIYLYRITDNKGNLIKEDKVMIVH